MVKLLQKVISPFSVMLFPRDLIDRTQQNIAVFPSDVYKVGCSDKNITYKVIFQNSNQQHMRQICTVSSIHLANVIWLTIIMLQIIWVNYIIDPF